LLKETDACSLTAAKQVLGTGFIYYALLVKKGIDYRFEKWNVGWENMRFGIRTAFHFLCPY